MKKNKLYTANKWNKPAFIVDRKGNLFLGGGGMGSLSANSPADFWGINTSINSPLPTTLSPQNNQALGAQQYLANQATHKMSNPFSFKEAFSSEGLKAGLKAGAGAAIGAGANLIGGLAGSAISGGLESGAGSAISGIGSSIGGAVSAVNPILGGAISVGSQLIGGLTNRMFGTKVDQAKLNAANEGTNKLQNFVSAASSFDDVKGPDALVKVQDPYSGGWFSSGSAREKNEALKRQRAEAESWAKRGVVNNINNLVNNQMSDLMANYSAFGGQLEQYNDNMGAIGYGFMSDYLTQKKKENEAKNKMIGISPMPAMNTFGHGGCFNPFALGGDVQTHGADFTNGLISINAGGSHELNPNDGVQLGVDPEGTPNLVEEGETVFDDYVYSNRILADAQTKKKFGLPRKKDITFADISKKLEKESSERPNDPISQAGLKAQMHQLADEQERQKQEMDAQRAKAAFEALSPEEQVAVMENAAQQEAMAEQAAMQQPSPEEIAMAQQQQAMADGSQAALGQEPQMMAEGGKLFAPGGYLWDKFWSPVNEYSKKKGNTKGKYQIDSTYKDDIKALENSDAYKAFTDYILNKATDEERTKYFQWIDANTGRDNKYFDKDGKLVDNWKDMYQSARTDGLYGIQHYTPEWQEAVEEAAAQAVEAKESQPEQGMELWDPNVDWDKVGRENAVATTETDANGVKVTRYTAPEAAKTSEKKKGVAQRHRPEWLRYAGLFGPAVGLGMMAAGIGRPDTAQLDAAVAGAGDVNTADWKPLGNYLTYRPLDIWFEQNRLNANARATDRAILNSGANQGSKMAGLLAAGYNDQIASGNLFRQAQEYNDNLRKQVAEFNRGTDQFNSEQYGATSRFNADAYNNARRANAQLRLQAAAQKMDADAGWYNSLYGNVAGLFKGIGDVGTENFRMNRIADMWADGIAGTASEETNTSKPWLKSSKKSDGGKVKKNKRRGLTF